MGLGGDLLWTPVLRRLAERNGSPVLLAARPKLTDILVGRSFDCSLSRDNSSVFQNNTFCSFNKLQQKYSIQKKIDSYFESLLHITKLKKKYENACYAWSSRRKFATVFLDLSPHSYAEQELPDRYVWKKPGHIIDILAKSVGLSEVPHQCEMYLEDNEYYRVDRLIKDLNIDKFVTIEPWTNTDYFGQLRAWPFDKWQVLTNLMRSCWSNLHVVQVGVGGNPVLPGCIDLTGRLSFREVAALIGRSRLFLGTEGGLMHVANAMNTNAVIVWGGVTLPEFAGYPDQHKIICNYVDCAPCGRLGLCPNHHYCMASIDVSHVFAALEERVAANSRNS